jgi:hypothetical protein
MKRFRTLLAVGSLLSLALNPAPAHALSKQVGGVVLVIAGGLAVGAGVFLFAVRYNAEDVDSPATAYVVTGAGVAAIVTGAVVLSSEKPEPKPEKKQSSLQLTPMHDGIALAYHF